MEQDLFDQLCFYTLAKADAEFIHQHGVDAFTAQRADKDTKPIAIVFALAGLYLHLEKGFTGREVQRAHMQMARRRKSWPRLALPRERGPVRVADVIAAGTGAACDAAIEIWCESVWGAYRGCREEIAQILREELDIR